MHFSIIQRLVAACLAIILSASVPPAKAETGNACIEATAALQQHLAPKNASERLHVLREGIVTAATRSGHKPHRLIEELLAKPAALASPATARPSLLPEATPLQIPPQAEAPLPAIINRLDGIHAQLDLALAEITEEQADRLRGLLPDLLDRTSTGSDLEQLEHGPVLAEVQSAVDQPALENVAALPSGDRVRIIIELDDRPK